MRFLGHEINVETQGSVGSQNTLTEEDISQADLVIIAADTKVEKSRFVNKRIYETSTKAAIHDGAKVVETAIDEAQDYRRLVEMVSEEAALCEVYMPMAAVMAAGMTPPLGLALATLLFKNRFAPDEREAGKAAWVLGASFITEGAIPFAAKDPFRVIPSIMVGSAVAAALSMIFGCELRVPHGGIFVLPIPNAVTNLALYVVATLAGTVVTAGMLFLLKRPLTATTRQKVVAAAGD